MKLSHRRIPERFARSMPRGFRLVERQGKDFLLVESVFCPRGHNLVVDSVRIHDEPSVKMKVVIGGEAGLVFVDAFWGSHAKLFSFVPVLAGKEAALADVYCPYCDALMIDARPCPERGCASEKAILLHLPGGKNKIHVCARLGCPGHVLDVVELPGQVVKAVSGINYFGEGGKGLLGDI